jgi:hypothetical protein
VVRHRRDLVQKRAALRCQIREHLDHALPGYAALFDNLWANPAALELALRFASPEAISAAGRDGLRSVLHEAHMRFQPNTLERVLAWAANAPAPAPAASTHQRLWRDLDADFQEKTRQIAPLERELAMLLSQTPYVLLLSHPGINVVSAAELAGEMGPRQLGDPCPRHTSMANRRSFSRPDTRPMARREIHPQSFFPPPPRTGDTAHQHHPRNSTWQSSLFSVNSRVGVWRGGVGGGLVGCWPFRLPVP